VGGGIKKKNNRRGGRKRKKSHTDRKKIVKLRSGHMDGEELQTQVRSKLGVANTVGGTKECPRIKL